MGKKVQGSRESRPRPCPNDAQPRAQLSPFATSQPTRNLTLCASNKVVHCGEEELETRTRIRWSSAISHRAFVRTLPDPEPPLFFSRSSAQRSVSSASVKGESNPFLSDEEADDVVAATAAPAAAATAQAAKNDEADATFSQPAAAVTAAAPTSTPSAPAQEGVVVSSQDSSREEKEAGSRILDEGVAATTAADAVDMEDEAVTAAPAETPLVSAAEKEPLGVTAAKREAVSSLTPTFQEVRRRRSAKRMPD